VFYPQFSLREVIMSEQVPTSILRQRVAYAFKFGARAGLTLGLGAVLFEEVLPEPLAKPIVVTTALATIVYNLWSWRQMSRWVKR